MAVTDADAAALRSYLAKGDDGADWKQQHEQLYQMGDPRGYGALVYATFVTAVRRRFSPTWTMAEVIQFVALVRRALDDDRAAVDPITAENLIRRALGDHVSDNAGEEAKAISQLILLVALVAEAGLDSIGLDQLLSEARAMADQIVS